MIRSADSEKKPMFQTMPEKEFEKLLALPHANCTACESVWDTLEILRAEHDDGHVTDGDYSLVHERLLAALHAHDQNDLTGSANDAIEYANTIYRKLAMALDERNARAEK